MTGISLAVDFTSGGGALATALEATDFWVGGTEPVFALATCVLGTDLPARLGGVVLSVFDTVLAPGGVLPNDLLGGVVPVDLGGGALAAERGVLAAVAGGTDLEPPVARAEGTDDGAGSTFPFRFIPPFTRACSPEAGADAAALAFRVDP